MPKTIATFGQHHPSRDLIDEHTSYSSHTRSRPPRPSKYLRHQEIRGEEFFVCPVCATSQSRIDHGELRQCDCGMLYEVYGNGMGMGKAK